MGDKKKWEAHVGEVSSKLSTDEKKVAKVMGEFKRGTLNIGKSKKKVQSKKQAVAIALSKAGKSKKKK